MSRTPGFTGAAVATLALGLGLNSAVSSLAYALFVKPLPFDGANRLVYVEQTLVERPALGYAMSYPDYLYFREHATRFSELAAHYATSPLQITTRDFTLGVNGSVVSANYFGVLRLQPALGRFFEWKEDRPGEEAVLVLSHDLWRTHFGRDPGVIGSELRVNGTAFRVIGVAPEGFRGVLRGIEPSSVFLPSSMFPVAYRYCDTRERDCRLVQLIGRLSPDASLGEAKAELSVLAGQLETMFPDTNRGRGVQLRPVRGVRLQEQVRNAPVVQLLAASAALVLAVASSNVAGLLLARGLQRRKEIAVRLALGASRARLVQQLLVESSMLSLGGGAAGLVVALWATGLLRGFFGVNSAGEALDVDFSLHPGVAAVALVVATLTGLLTGLAPALQATRRETLPALRDEPAGLGPRGSRLRDGLIVAQVATSALLLAGSALLVRSFLQIQRGPGFDPRAVAILRLCPSLLGYSAERSWAFQREVVRRLEALPGVVAASPADVPPLPGWRTSPFRVQRATDAADPAHAPRFDSTPVGPRYFRALGTGVVQGREFDERDTPESPRVAILNQSMARRLFPEGDAVGSRILISRQPHEVVGLVADVQFVRTLEQPVPMIYLNYWQQDPSLTWSHDSRTHVRVSGSATAALPELRRAIAAIDPDVPVSEAQSFADQLDYAFVEVRAARALLLSFAAMTLGLSAIGLYAALAFAVTQRSREIAIRISLGAARADVGRLVLQHGLAIVALGAGLGTAAAAALGPLLAHLLYGVSPRDALALLVGPVLIAVVGLGAIWLPARRALAVDPMTVLRSQ
jgi:putative ABC transport system permease protein